MDAKEHITPAEPTSGLQRTQGQGDSRTENEGKQPGRLLKECDGISCNIGGTVTVEYCTVCEYHDSGCGGFDY